jgi:hypothetical protein
VYGCHTCNKKNSENQQNLIISGNGKKMLGFCLYCVETEHKDHEVFEVGLRKHFRCDSFQPTLEEAKTPVGQVDGAPE